MTSQATFTVYQDTDSQWRWRLLSANGRVVCQGEGHPNKQNAVRAARSVKRWAEEAEIVVPSAKPAIKTPLAKPMSKRVLQKPAIKKTAIKKASR